MFYISSSTRSSPILFRHGIPLSFMNTASLPYSGEIRIKPKTKLIQLSGTALLTTRSDGLFGHLWKGFDFFEKSNCCHHITTSRTIRHYISSQQRKTQTQRGSRCRIIWWGGITSKIVFVKHGGNSLPVIFLKTNSSRHSSDTNPLKPATRTLQRKLSASREQKWDSLSAWRRMTEMATTRNRNSWSNFLGIEIKKPASVIEIKDLRKNDAKDVIKVRFMKFENNYR